MLEWPYVLPDEIENQEISCGDWILAEDEGVAALAVVITPNPQEQQMLLKWIMWPDYGLQWVACENIISTSLDVKHKIERCCEQITRFKGPTPWSKIDTLFKFHHGDRVKVHPPRGLKAKMKGYAQASITGRIQDRALRQPSKIDPAIEDMVSMISHGTGTQV